MKIRQHREIIGVLKRASGRKRDLYLFLFFATLMILCREMMIGIGQEGGDISGQEITLYGREWAWNLITDQTNNGIMSRGVSIKTEQRKVAYDVTIQYYYWRRHKNLYITIYNGKSCSSFELKLV